MDLFLFMIFIFIFLSCHAHRPKPAFTGLKLVQFPPIRLETDNEPSEKITECFIVCKQLYFEKTLLFNSRVEL